MEKYNYRRVITDNIKSWIQMHDLSNIGEDIYEYLNEELWYLDCITGNGAYWYDNEEKCEEYICHNLDLVFEACNEFCINIDTIRKYMKQNAIARYLDCTIRCYLLSECIDNALKELNYE